MRNGQVSPAATRTAYGASKGTRPPSGSAWPSAAPSPTASCTTPAGLPDPLLHRIHAVVVAALRSPDAAEKLPRQDMPSAGSMPEEFAACPRRKGG